MLFLFDFFQDEDGSRSSRPDSIDEIAIWMIENKIEPNSDFKVVQFEYEYF